MRGFNESNYQDPGNRSMFELVPEGEHFARINEAIEKQSRSGKDQIFLKLSFQGHEGEVFHYITDNGTKYWDWELGDLFDSFGIKPGDMNLRNWSGKVGMVRIVHEEVNGKTYARIKDYILKSRQPMKADPGVSRPFENAANGEPWQTW